MAHGLVATVLCGLILFRFEQGTYACHVRCYMYNSFRLHVVCAQYCPMKVRAFMSQIASTHHWLGILYWTVR